MSFVHRRLWSHKPKQFGPFSVVHSSLFENAERMGIPAPGVALPVWERAGNQVKNYGALPGYDGTIIGTGIQWTKNGLSCPADVNSYVTFSHCPKIGLLGTKLSLVYGLSDLVHSGASDTSLSILSNFLQGQYTNHIWDYRGGATSSWLYIASVAGNANLGLQHTGTYAERIPLNRYGVTVETNNAVGFINGAYAATDTSVQFFQNYNFGLAAYLPRLGGDVDGSFIFDNYLLWAGVTLPNSKIALLSDNPYALWQRVAPISYFFQSTSGSTLLPIFYNHYKQLAGA